jgi:hypothetical protein
MLQQRRPAASAKSPDSEHDLSPGDTLPQYYGQPAPSQPSCPRVQSLVIRIVLGIFFLPPLLFFVLSIPAQLYRFLNPSADPCKLLIPSSSMNPLTSSSFKIPILVHTQLRDPTIIPTHHRSWLAALPDPASHMYWTDDACLSLITDHYPFFLDVYTSYPLNIQRLDSCRYFLLDKYGGIYKDGDLSLVIPAALESAPDPSDPSVRAALSQHVVRFLNQLPSSGVGVVESPYKYNEDVQNSLMTSPPSHPFWKDVMFPLLRERKDTNGVLESTGPGILSEGLRRWSEKTKISEGGGTELVSQGVGALGGVQVLPCELFQRIPLGNRETTGLNILGRELLTRLYPMKQCGDFDREDDCQITRHYGAASWTSGSIK